MPQTARVRIARQQVKRIDAVTREAESLKRELRDPIREQRPELLEETGCGPLTAAILIGQTAGAERASRATPTSQDSPASHRSPSPRANTTAIAWTGGNRQINWALHVIAITRGRLDPEPRAYLQRKEAEGKTRMEAMRCLKRHLARRYYRLLSDRSRHRIEHQVYPGVP
jgi:transposase